MLQLQHKSRNVGPQNVMKYSFNVVFNQTESFQLVSLCTICSNLVNFLYLHGIYWFYRNTFSIWENKPKQKIILKIIVHIWWTIRFGNVFQQNGALCEKSDLFLSSSCYSHFKNQDGYRELQVVRLAPVSRKIMDQVLLEAISKSRKDKVTGTASKNLSRANCPWPLNQFLSWNDRLCG